MELDDHGDDNDAKHIITHEQLMQIESHTAELYEYIQYIIERVDEIKENPNKIQDILEAVRKTNAAATTTL